ncbi:hypothetical protein [Vibrio sp. 10N.247.311.51]|uniref:hypothetical protein n=1 Tax=Vibrio sp. 10N.247.311.51 TaxID=3229996 RepID=UPI0035517A4F
MMIENTVHSPSLSFMDVIYRTFKVRVGLLCLLVLVSLMLTSSHVFWTLAGFTLRGLEVLTLCEYIHRIRQQTQKAEPNTPNAKIHQVFILGWLGLFVFAIGLGLSAYLPDYYPVMFMLSALTLTWVTFIIVKRYQISIHIVRMSAVMWASSLLLMALYYGWFI